MDLLGRFCIQFELVEGGWVGTPLVVSVVNLVVALLEVVEKFHGLFYCW